MGALDLLFIWLPEVSIPNNIFVEPVTGVEEIDRNRWRLVCFICKQKMGACIQCSNKKCSQAYHPTCGRKARLYMKMTAGIHGALVDQSTVISFCDKHTPIDFKPKSRCEADRRDCESILSPTWPTGLDET